MSLIIILIVVSVLVIIADLKIGSKPIRATLLVIGMLALVMLAGSRGVSIGRVMVENDYDILLRDLFTRIGNKKTNDAKGDIIKVINERMVNERWSSENIVNLLNDPLRPD